MRKAGFMEKGKRKREAGQFSGLAGRRKEAQGGWQFSSVPVKFLSAYCGGEEGMLRASAVAAWKIF